MPITLTKGLLTAISKAAHDAPKPHDVTVGAALQKSIPKLGAISPPKPIEAYHGTPHGNFGEFDNARAENGAFGPGHYFTRSKQVAQLYARGANGHVHHVFLHVNKLYNTDSTKPIGKAMSESAHQELKDRYVSRGGLDAKWAKSSMKKITPLTPHRELMGHVVPRFRLGEDAHSFTRIAQKHGYQGLVTHTYDSTAPIHVIWDSKHIHAAPEPTAKVAGATTKKGVSPHNVSQEARVPKGSKGSGEFTRTGAAAQAKAPAPAEAPDANPAGLKPPKGIFSMPMKNIRMDAARFQFRQDVNPDSGTDDRLAGVEKFDPFLAGIISVWKEPSTGRVYVADGHHRYSLAKRLKVREVNVQFIDAPTAQQAMCIAGIRNIAEGHATSLDAARLLRANKIGEKFLRKANVALTGTLAEKALALSSLAEPVYQDVLHGRMNEGRAVAIAQAFLSEAAHVAVRDMLNRPEYRRKRMSGADIRELAHFVNTAGKQTKTVHTLFGDESLVRSLAVEKAQISAGVKANLKADKTLFGFVAKQGRAEALKRGNNVIDAGASGIIHTEATRMLETYDRLAGYAGPVSAVLNAAAKQLASGGDKNVIVTGVYGEIRRLLGEQFGNAHAAGAGPGGTGSGAADEGRGGLAGEVHSDGGLFLGVGAGGRAPALDRVFKAAGKRQSFQVGGSSYLTDTHPGTLSLGEYTRKWGGNQKLPAIRAAHDAAVQHAASTGLVKPAVIHEHDPDLYSLNGAQHSRVSDVLSRLASSAAHTPKHIVASDAGQVRLEWTHGGKTQGMAITKTGTTSLKEGLKPEHLETGGWRVLKKYADTTKGVKVAMIFKAFSQHIGDGKVDGVWGEHNGKNAFIAKNGDIYQRSGGKSTPFTVVNGKGRDVTGEARVPKGSPKGGEFTRIVAKKPSATPIAPGRPAPTLRPFEKEHEAAARGIVFHNGELRWADEIKGQPTGFQRPRSVPSPTAAPQSALKQQFLDANRAYHAYHERLLEPLDAALEASVQEFLKLESAYKSQEPNTAIARSLKKKMDATGWKSNAYSSIFGPSPHSGQAVALQKQRSDIIDGKIHDPKFLVLRDEMRRLHGLLTGNTATTKGVKIALLFKGGCTSCKPNTLGKSPKPGISQALRDADHANRHAVSGACDHENADKVMIAGEGGKKYPATHCKRCGRIAMDDKKHHGLASGKVPLPTLKKAIASNCYKNPGDCDLKWITAHPGNEEPGVPLLVHDNGEEYTVVGGAGGSMNQQVFKKPKGDGSGNERKAQMKEKRIAKQKAARESLGADAQDLEDKKKALHEEAKRQTNDLTNRVLAALGDQFQGNALDKVKTEAQKRAVKEHPNATEGEQKEFADKAGKEAVNEASEAARKVVQSALNAAAMRALGDDDGSTPAEFAATISGKQLVKKFTPEELDSFVQASANIAALKGKAKAIARALVTGDQDAVQGIQADCAPLSPEEAKQHNLDQYLKGVEVDANVNLVKGSEAASVICQRRNQANGASDGINSFVASKTGNAILGTDTVKTLGVENAARVAAFYMTQNGVDAKTTAEGLRTRLSQESYGQEKAALDECDDIDKLVAGAKAAAAEGDGSVTTAQASIQAANGAVQKYKLLNTTRGQVRVAAAMAHFLEHPSKRSMSLPSGSTVIAAHAFAKGLGLQEGEYTVEKSAQGEGGGYKVTVKAEDLHKLATPHKLAESDRNIQADEIRQAVEATPGQTDLPGFRKDRMLQPHQEVAVKAITEMKHTVLSYGAGSGKTAILMAAGSKLLASGKIDKGLITMPAKPLAQQNDYTDPEDGETKQGEIGKFLDGDAAKNFVVCNGSDQVAKALKRIKGGEKLMLMMTPDAMRNNAAALKEAGFGGEKSAFFADEAHRFAVGQTEGTGSGMAKIAGDFAKSEYSSYMSGTLIENNASELWSALDAIHPGQFGGQKAFTEEWQRLSKGQQGLFAPEAMRGMRDRLSGSMFSYHSPVKGANGEALTLESNVVTVKSTPAQKAAIAKINAEYKKRKASADPAISKGASFWRYSSTKQILTDGAKGDDGVVVNPKLEALQEIMEDEKERSPQNRIGVYAFNKSTLADAQKHLGVKSTRITGDEKEKQTASAVKKVNDRENGLGAAYLSNAANYGLNLQGLDRIVKMHALDTPSMEDQLDHRHFRTGQTRNVRATTILTDHPAEQLAQFRNKSMKAPEVHLLAALADDTGAASVLAKNMNAIKAAAGK